MDECKRNDRPTVLSDESLESVLVSLQHSLRKSIHKLCQQTACLTGVFIEPQRNRNCIHIVHELREFDKGKYYITIDGFCILFTAVYRSWIIPSTLMKHGYWFHIWDSVAHTTNDNVVQALRGKHIIFRGLWLPRFPNLTPMTLDASER